MRCWSWIPLAPSYLRMSKSTFLQKNFKTKLKILFVILLKRLALYFSLNYFMNAWNWLRPSLSNSASIVRIVHSSWSLELALQFSKRKYFCIIDYDRDLILGSASSQADPLRQGLFTVSISQSKMWDLRAQECPQAIYFTLINITLKNRFSWNAVHVISALQ